MSDISITITSDPSQALQGISATKKAAEDLNETARKSASSSDSAATDAINRISVVSRSAAQSVAKTSDAVSKVGKDIQKAAGDASKVAGAFGDAVPVVGRLGSAVASALTGPIGAISAVIGLAIAGIQKMLADTQDRLDRMKAAAGAQSGAAYERLMQGRAQYAADLQTLAQVRELNTIAAKNGLDSGQLATFRDLAGQIGIEARYVGAKGIRPGMIDQAERELLQQRRFYADQEYQDYLDAMQQRLQKELEASGLNRTTKTNLKQMSLFDAAAAITSRAQRGAGQSMEEFKAYQDLYAIVKPLAEVRASYNRDALLGRSQADLNAASLDAIRSAHPSGDASGSSGSGGAPVPGTLAWQKEQDKKAAAAAEAAAKEQQRRAAAGDAILQKLQEELGYQTLISQGKAREAEVQRQVLHAEETYGRKLTEEEQARIESLAGALYDLRHPAEPELAPPDPSAPETPARARARVRLQAASVPLDSLQRIGANFTRAAAMSPEKLALDKTNNLVEDIRNMMRAEAAAPQTAVMRF